VAGKTGSTLSPVNARRAPNRSTARAHRQVAAQLHTDPFGQPAIPQRARHITVVQLRQRGQHPVLLTSCGRLRIEYRSEQLGTACQLLAHVFDFLLA